MKSKIYGNPTITTSDIIKALRGNDSLDCLNAIRYCVLNSLNEKEIIDALLKLKSSEMVEWNTAKISENAIAALHILGVEKYSGNTPQILDLIETRFFSEDKTIYTQ